MDYQYNGVEFEDALGLNLYEMDVRMYDPAIGRFNGVDPITHFSQGTSVAFDNNPIYWADPSGADSIYNFDTGQYVINGQVVSQEEAIAYAKNGGNADGSNNNTPDEDCCGGDKKKKTMADAGALYAKASTISGGGYVAAMDGRDPYNPTEEDIAEANAALGQTVLFIAGEWATVKIFQGGAWVIRTIRAKNIAKGAKFVNLASESRTVHILAGDATGGGHAWWGSWNSFWNGLTGAKSMFPVSWSNKRIMNAISEVATSNPWIQQTGKIGATHTRSGQLVRYQVEGTIDGVKMKVITTVEEIITAFPIK